MIQYDKMSNKLGHMQLKRMNKNISFETIRNVFSSLITYYKRIIIKALLNLEITQQKTEHDHNKTTQTYFSKKNRASSV